MTVYMLVSHDQYELPMMVCDTATELARRCGTTRNAVYSAIRNAQLRGYRCKYVKVDIGEDGNK